MLWCLTLVLWPICLKCLTLSWQTTLLLVVIYGVYNLGLKSQKHQPCVQHLIWILLLKPIRLKASVLGCRACTSIKMNWLAPAKTLASAARLVSASILVRQLSTYGKQHAQRWSLPELKSLKSIFRWFLTVKVIALERRPCSIAASSPLSFSMMSYGHYQAGL